MVEKGKGGRGKAEGREASPHSISFYKSAPAPVGISTATGLA